MRHYILFFIIAVGAVASTFLAGPSFAQVDVGFNEVGQEIALGTTDIRVTIANIIRVFMGLLGIIAVLIVIYGGYLWTTSAGNLERVAKAKQVLIAGVIGLVITLSAYGIASFAINSIQGAADGGAPIAGPGGPGGGGGPGPGGGGLPNNGFFVSSITPQGSIPVRNATVRVIFSSQIDQATVPGNITVRRTSDNSVVPGTLSTNQQTVTFTPSNRCPAPNDGLNCFAPNAEYRVSVTGGITGVKSSDNRQVTCAVGSPCTSTFQIGDQVDVVAPTAQMTAPVDGGSVQVDAVIDLRAQATDDAGVSSVDFQVDGNFLGTDAPIGNTPTNYNASVSWDTTGLALNSQNTISATVQDIDAHSTDSSSITVTVRAQHCFNGTQDEDETGLDCGGANCGVCAGGQCQENHDCQQDLCVNGVCVSTPLIAGIQPDNGAPGNLITVFGQGFGNTEGGVVFLGADGDQDDVVTQAAGLCGPDAWSQTQVLVQVPAGAASGPIRLVEADSGSDFFDSTNDDRGYIGDFNVNNVIRPGLCSIAPDSGVFQTSVTLQGENFGANADRVLFGGFDIGGDANLTWSDTEISGGFVPNIMAGMTDVWVQVGNEFSNPVAFNVIDTEDRPEISFLNPTAGGVGQYVSIIGGGFGNNIGLVEFTSPAFGDVAADVSFPQQCSQDYWKDDVIVVKVPNIPANEQGNYDIRVTTSDGVQSNLEGFLVNNAAAQPGVCHVEPDNGPIGTTVNAYGEGFGSVQGQFQFFDRENAPISTWQTGQVTGDAPLGARTGPLRIVTDQGVVSNTVNFEVNNCTNGNACGAGEECCRTGICQAAGTCQAQNAADYYRFSFTTGDILYPFELIDSYPQCDEVCPEGVARLFFSAPIGAQGSVRIEECLDGQACTQPGPVVSTTQAVTNDMQAQEYSVSLTPDTDLLNDTYYRVLLFPGWTSDQGVPFDTFNYDIGNDGSNDAFSWVFKTRETGNCTIDRVEFHPDNYLSEVQNEEVVEELRIFGEPDACSANGQELDPNDYFFQWGLGGNPLDTVVFGPNVGNGPTNSFITNNQGTAFINVRGWPNDNAIIAANPQGLHNAQTTIVVDLNLPEIDTVSPDDGLVFSDEITTYVSISGRNFGDQKTTQRRVVFTGQNAQVEANSNQCFSWKDDEIVVGVPFDPSFSLGDLLAVSVQTERGVDTWQSFEVRDFIRPAICRLDPSEALEGKQIASTGLNYGDVEPDNSSFDYGRFDFNPGSIQATVNRWSNTLLNTVFPAGLENLRSIRPYGAVVDARVTVLTDHESNTKDLLLEPFISDITPDVGAPSSWITIRGGNFGDDPGNNGAVIFEDTNGSPIELTGNMGLPAYCGDNWHDDEIVVVVPTNAVPALVRVRTDANLTTVDERSRQFFPDTLVPLGPGLCTLDPDPIARGAALTLRGANFEQQTQGSRVIIPTGELDLSNQGDSWADQTIVVTTPTDMLSGQVSVRKELQVQTGRQCVGGVLIGENCINGSFQPIIESIFLDSNALSVTVQNGQVPQTCGNGVFEPLNGEQCDQSDPTDPNVNSCVNCQILGQPGSGYCGDTIIQQPNGNNETEMCDLGAANGSCQNPGCCTLMCQVLGPANGVCGDGQVNAGDGEQCDLGVLNGQPGANCTIACQNVVNNCNNPVCGNNIVEVCNDPPPYIEECDGTPDCDVNCRRLATCQPNQTVCGQNCCAQGIQCDVNTNTCANQAQCQPPSPNMCGNTCCTVACVNGNCPDQISVTVLPANNETNVCRNTQVQVTFNKDMILNSFEGNVFLLDAQNQPQPITTGYISDSRTLNISPTSALSPNTVYTARIEAGPEAQDGSQILAPIVWQFTTGVDICQIDRVRVTMQPPSPVCTDDNGLLLHFNFDEQQNDITALDQSENSFHSTILNPNSVTPRQNSDVGGFGLSSSVADPVYVDAGPNTFFDFSNEATVSFWARPAQYPAANQHGIIFWNGDTPNNAGRPSYYIGVNEAGRVVVQTGNTSSFSQNALPTNSFSFVTVVFTNPGVKIYIDGVLETDQFNQQALSGPSYVRVGFPYDPNTQVPGIEAFQGIIDEVKLYSRAKDEEELTHCSSDLFSCFGDDCAFDVDLQTPGNQHRYVALALDSEDRAVAANYTWTEIDEEDVFSADNQVGTVVQTTSKDVNGVGSVVVQAIGTIAGSGSADEVVTVTTNICANPWGFTDNTYHVAFSYCADRGEQGIGDDLPLLLKTTVSNPPQPPLQPECQNLLLLRDVLFDNPAGEDALGLRVFNNPVPLRPQDWYNRCVPNPGAPSSAQIGGYQALIDGRTTYAFAGNVTDQGGFFTNVYVLSHSDNASADLLSILDQVVPNMRFNINIPSKRSKEQIVRDIKRLSDVTHIEELLNRYFQANGAFPDMAQGSFLPGITYSTWPSWQTLGTILGETLPIDPINRFNDCPGYDSTTCFDINQTPAFADPQGFVYKYEFNQGIASQLEFP